MEKNKEEKKFKPIIEQKQFWIKIGIALVIFLIWRSYTHTNWCKQEVQIYGVNNSDEVKFYDYGGGIIAKKGVVGKFKTYDDAVSSCKAGLTKYIFKSHK